MQWTTAKRHELKRWVRVERGRADDAILELIEKHKTLERLATALDRSRIGICVA
ncbi:MAG: hypothetical protein ACR2PS_12705 [Pseudomonadales bacterium]